MLILAVAAVLAAQSSDVATAPQPASASTAPGDKIRCKRELETGSLVKSKKTCRTVAEWDAIRRDARESSERMRDGFRPGAPGN